jgi:putative two-component system response regulator
MAALIALSHHEWYDGKGYPQRLSGDQIPLEGRIVAVADVFDALTSDRVYRPAFPVAKAIEMMRDERGTHFDPPILDILLESVEEIVALGRTDGRSNGSILASVHA